MKKVSLFVSSELQKLLAENRDWTEAYRVALSFFAELVIHGSSFYDLGPWIETHVSTPPHGGDGGGYAKAFCGCHSEADDTKVLFREAQRVEGRVWIDQHTTEVHLMLELQAYKRGAKEPFTKKLWPFPSKNPQHKVLNPKAV